MGERPARLVVQILSNDHPPFNDIAICYRLALESLGLRVLTVVMGPTHGAAVPGACYLDLEDVGKVKAAGLALAACLQGKDPVLAICHRYRAYRVLRSSGTSIPGVVAIAHEFGFFARARRRLERALFARHVLFAGVSPAVQAELGQSVPEPLCIPNALDLEGFESVSCSREQALAQLGVPASSAFTVGLVGRLVSKKAPQLGVLAVQKLRQDGHDVRLLVIGDGPLRTELELLAEGLPVVFCGFVPNARRLLKALDVMLLTSSDAEAFGMVALEAMVSGVPVVAGPSPGPQFVLGGSGYYYMQRDPEEVAEALLRVQADNVAHALGERAERGKNRALREFSISALARHLDELLIRSAGSVE